MLTLVAVAVIAAVARFLLDGVAISIAGHVFAFSKTDPLAYGSLLTPILGAHGYMNTRPNTINPIQDGSNPEIDDPDAD